MVNNDDAKVGTDAFRSFFQQFGPDDVYTRIIIEVLLEELLKKDTNTSIKEIKNGERNN